MNSQSLARELDVAVKSRCPRTHNPFDISRTLNALIISLKTHTIRFFHVPSIYPSTPLGHRKRGSKMSTLASRATSVPHPGSPFRACAVNLPGTRKKERKILPVTPSKTLLSDVFQWQRRSHIHFFWRKIGAMSSGCANSIEYAVCALLSSRFLPSEMRSDGLV